MDFAFSEEQEFLRRTARDWLDAKAPSEVVRRLMDDDLGHDPALWSAIADLGWQAMAIPEAYGGAGFGFLEQAVLLEEMGRALFPSPYLGSAVLAAHAILGGGDEDQREAWLPGIASGETIATVALGETGPTSTTVTAIRAGEGWVLDGEARFVVDAATADLVVVPATVPDGLGLFVVDVGADGVGVESLPTLDQTRRLAHLRFVGVQVGPGEHLVAAPAGDVLERVVRLGSVALALEAVGGAGKVLETSVQYAKDRVQFGRPIGSFQAIKHLCADMLVAVESATAAAYYAAWAAAEDDEELAVVAPLAKAYCTEAYFQCAAANIQVHGGIGFTWEHDAHLHFKRAKSSEVLLGDATTQRLAVADRLGI